MNKPLFNVVFFLLFAIPVSIFAQQVERSLINPELKRRNLNVHVTNTQNESQVKRQTIGSIRLQPQEIKAVVKTDSQIVEVDRSVVSRFQNVQNLGKVYMLPELYLTKIAGTNEQVKYRILMIDATPLRFDFNTNFFNGVIQFIPVEVLAAGANPSQKELAAPEEIIVKYGSTSESIKVKSINWPPIDFNVSTPDPLDSFEVKVLTIVNPLGYSKMMKVEPAVVLSSQRQKIQGLGIQTIPIYVSLKGVTSCNPPVNISINSSKGNIENAALALADDTPHEVKLRSENIGKINLSVINSNLKSNSIELESIFPWLFFVLAIVGGLIGSLAKALSKNEKVKMKALLLGILFGLIAATVYWGLGINLLGIQVSVTGLNEIMVLALGFLAGFFGIRNP